MSLRLQGYIRRVGPKHPVDRAVMLALAEWIDDRNVIPETYPYLHEICDSTGFGRTAIIDSLARLQQAGWLTITKCGQHAPSIYQLNKVASDDANKPVDSPYKRARPTALSDPPRGPLKESRGTPDGCLKPSQASATRTSKTFRHSPDGPLKESRGTPDGPLHNRTRARSPYKTPLQKPLPVKAPTPQAAQGHGGLHSRTNGHAKDDPIRAAVDDFENRTRLHDRSTLRAVRRVITADVRDQRGTPYNIANEMASAWELYGEHKPLLRYHWKPSNFFLQDHWRKPGEWPYDEGRLARWRQAHTGVVH